MNDRNAQAESGQVLVTVAVAMVALLLVLALAVDVGHVYQERRDMQNAADAGALACAREICFGDPASAESAGQYYALQNSAQVVDVTITDGYICDVTASMDADTIFGGIIGMQTVNVGGFAQATCGSANTACGLWPVGFDRDRYEELYAGGFGCGTPFYVWSGDNINQAPDCEVYDCDVDGNLMSDIVDMTQRAWLDFSDVVDAQHPDDCVQAGCGAAELGCWLRNDSGGQVTLPACIAGDTGVKAGVKADVNSRIGEQVAIPLYSGTGCMGVTCPGTSISATAWGCITVLGWDQSLELPRLDGANPPWKGPVIAATVACEGCQTYCGSTHGGPPIPGGIVAVSLTQ